MKSRIIISLVLAVLMLATVAAPVSAGRPTKKDLVTLSGAPGTASASLQVTHDNNLKVTVVLIGVHPEVTYDVYVDYIGGCGVYKVGEVTTSAQGRARFSVVTGNPCTSGAPWALGTGERFFDVQVWVDTYVRYDGQGDINVTFK